MNIEIGAAAERLAAQYLQSRGLTLLAHNLRCKGGELDLVASEGATLAIVEVRYRSRGDFGGALASVTFAKRRRMLRAARYFACREAAWSGRALRIDVIAVHGDLNGDPRIEWVKDAFRCA
jgi:putative endonuclease